MTMKRLGKWVFVVAVVLSLFLTMAVLSASADPIHVGGSSVSRGSAIHVGGSSSPIHVGGSSAPIHVGGS
jgi:hypothetical protein